MISRLIKINSTSIKWHPIRLNRQQTLIIYLHPPTIQQVPILRAIEEVLWREDDRRISFGVEGDLQNINV
jgi:hypothetical protein